VVFICGRFVGDGWWRDVGIGVVGFMVDDGRASIHWERAERGRRFVHATGHYSWPHVGRPTPRFGVYRWQHSARETPTSEGSPSVWVTDDRIEFPIWLPALLGSPAGAAWAEIFFRRRFRFADGLCARCGYDLRATPHRCPECAAIPAEA
jgi:hypothetical protein